MHIRNPVEWGVDQIKFAGSAIERVGHRADEAQGLPLPAIRRITLGDLRDALARGFEDFAAFRTDVLFLCVIYPVVGLFLARLAFGYEMLPLLFPLASGFALIGPVAAVGLYEMSRRREAGAEVSWADAFGVIRAPSVGAIVRFGLLLMAIFLAWLNVAIAIYDLTLGPAPPVSLGGFARDLFTTDAGWLLIGVGIGVGFLFAVLVLTISVVSVPLLLDREVGVTYGDSHLAARRGAQPGPDGGVGPRRRRRAGDRLRSLVPRPHHRDAGARARDVAPLPPGRRALTTAERRLRRVGASAGSSARPSRCCCRGKTAGRSPGWRCGSRGI